MFTDGPVTPARLEVLFDLLSNFQKGLEREAIYNLLQPPPLSEGTQNTAKDTVGAALQLNMVTENRTVIGLSSSFDRSISAKENILRSSDRNILSSLEIEPYLALFYAYYLGLDDNVYPLSKLSRDEWANRFNDDVFKGIPQSNPFNATKHTGLDRWMCYLGLGWYDSSDEFQANPYERILRALPGEIFGKKTKIDGDQFMARLAHVCPELDGGAIFNQANLYRDYKVEAKQCSLGLSHALIDMHEDGVLRLICPVDSHGWNIGIAMPPLGDTIESDRITAIEYLGQG